MNDPAAGKIFLSYRRDDTQHMAGRLCDRLAEQFGATNIFMDVNSIEPGLDFGDVIESAVGGCDVLIALVGIRWLVGIDERGRRRLDNPDDLVMLEIKSALDRNIRVIPVLVDGAAAPGRDELPESIAGLARRSAVRVDHETFSADVRSLADVVARAVRARPTAAASGDASESPQSVDVVALGGLSATAESTTPIHVIRASPSSQSGREGDALTLPATESRLASTDFGTADQTQATNQDIARRRHAKGHDDPAILRSTNGLAAGLSALGRHSWARELDEDTLTRLRRVLGGDHPSTLASANNLAVGLRALGEYRQALEVDEDMLSRFRQAAGGDHPATLVSASNLASDLSLLQEYQRAYELDKETLVRRRRTLGEDHPDSLVSANNVAVDLSALGEHQRARVLDGDNVRRFVRVLGEDHPDTLVSVNNLAVNLDEDNRTTYDIIFRRLSRGKVIPVLGDGANLWQRSIGLSWERGRLLPLGSAGRSI